MPMWLLHVPLMMVSNNSRQFAMRPTYHQILKGSSKRVISMPWSSLRALSPRACLPGEQHDSQSTRYGNKGGEKLAFVRVE